MKTLDESAREIIGRAMERTHSRNYVSKFYGVAPEIVSRYQEGKDCGALRAREVIRVEISRLNAEKKGVSFYPTDKDRYKGTREY